ncbi:hypothetical protein D9M73_110580 [compost metagenome]
MDRPANAPGEKPPTISTLPGNRSKLDFCLPAVTMMSSPDAGSAVLRAKRRG